METLNHSIIVPYDFTEVAMNAVAHAVILSKQLDTGITLLHIVKKDTEIKEMEQQLSSDALRVNELHNIKPNTLVREGSIFKTINQVAHELDATLIVMGTHGMKGLQKLTGSWALKVIVGSKIPFLVIQDAPKLSEDQLKLVFPVDFKSENKEKLKWVQFMNKHFPAKTLLFSSTSKEGVVEPRTKANLVFCKSFLEEKKIDYELVLSKNAASFSQETIDFAKSRNADIIIIMTTRDIAFHDYVLGAQEQYMIANSAKIPVMVINPRTDLMKYGYGNFG
ncbi:universal stress protein [Natronoflexus pectinivorans]|uniref:Nucleotide-binding universal stress UspA family protein n=1 Tax=Natronoflexus pectinivorans TaxID=682526 RepID=A0A4R2GNL6_9BACT|nr:universal stress protein [Natronoflexus pectinivorans]TCO10914.1 nucleotide-binding universal stress UspA family protein [Natronoflexus pectinivorans]